jgi:hypothetical protein
MDFLPIIGTHIDLQSTSQNDLNQYEPHKKQGANTSVLKGEAVPALLVAPVLLLFNYTNII